MPDPRLDALARVIVRHCAPVRPGDLVTIVGDPTSSAWPAFEAVFEAVLDAGAHPSVHVRSARLHEILVRRGTDAQLTHECPFERHRLERCDVLIVLMHALNTRYLGALDPERIAAVQAARKGLLSMSMRRLAEGATRYVLTEIPSHAAAQEAGMSLADYEDFVYRAGLLHMPDPVGAWQAQRARQQVLCDFLATKRTLRFRAPPVPARGGAPADDGTDLTVDVGAGTWINCSADQNFPDGEVFTGPGSVNGVVNFTHPVVYKGQPVEGVRLVFRDGRVVDAAAARNEGFLLAMLDQDEGARNAGEIALGTNYQLTRFMCNPFFEEKIGGTFHVAVGAGYPQSGNSNQSALHWDMVCDLRHGGTVHADGELIQRDGLFVDPAFPSPFA